MREWWCVCKCNARVLVWMRMWVQVCAHTCVLHVCKWVHVWMSEHVCASVCTCIIVCKHTWVCQHVCVRAPFSLREPTMTKTTVHALLAKKPHVKWGDSMNQHSCTPSQEPLHISIQIIPTSKTAHLSSQHGLRSLCSHFHMNYVPILDKPTLSDASKSLLTFQCELYPHFRLPLWSSVSCGLPPPPPPPPPPFHCPHCKHTHLRCLFSEFHVN